MNYSFNIPVSQLYVMTGNFNSENQRLFPKGGVVSRLEDDEIPPHPKVCQEIWKTEINLTLS